MSQILRWDFQKPLAANPLTDEIAGATLAVAGGASTDTTDGLVITDACESRAASTSLPAALSPSRPISLVLPIRFTDTKGFQAFSMCAGWLSGGTRTGLLVMPHVDASPTSEMRFLLDNGESYSTPDWNPGLPPATDAVLIAIFEGTRKRLIANGTTVIDVSGTYSGGIGTTDFRIGKDGCFPIAWRTPFFALYDHALTADEISAIGATFASARDALFAPPETGGPSPAAIQYYRRLNGLIP